MARRLLGAAGLCGAAGSLALCVAVTVLWIESFWWMEIVSRTRFVEPRVPDHIEAYVLQLWSSSGMLIITGGRGDCGPVGRSFPTPWPFHVRAAAKPISDKVFAFHLAKDGFGIATPHWAVLPVLGIPAGLGLWRYLKRRTRRLRTEQGMCLHCGYDLTGNTSGVCPECGTRFLKPQIDADARR